MTTRDSVHRFSRTVENYVKYRPTYPQAMADFLVSQCSLGDESIVADIGSGTGRVAQLFLENGYQVIGVEPNDHMRSAGQQALKDYAMFASVKGTAEATTLADQSVDLITVGQAFHWFNPLTTRQEFVRLLKAQGWVVLVWNIPRQDSPFMKEYQRLRETYTSNKSRLGHFTGETAAARIQEFFAPQAVAFERINNSQTVDYTALRGLVLSSSFAPKPDQPEYGEMLDELERLFQTYEQDNQVTIDYDCLVNYGQLSSV